MNLTDAEMVTLGIGGAVLLAGLLASFPEATPPSWKLWAIAICVIVGAIMLVCSLYDMIAN